jgi:hypothetical protein
MNNITVTSFFNWNYNLKSLEHSIAFISVMALTIPIMALSKTTFSITTLSITIKKHVIQFKRHSAYQNTQHIGT